MNDRAPTVSKVHTKYPEQPAFVQKDLFDSRPKVLTNTAVIKPHGTIKPQREFHLVLPQAVTDSTPAIWQEDLRLSKIMAATTSAFQDRH